MGERKLSPRSELLLLRAGQLIGVLSDALVSPLIWPMELATLFGALLVLFTVSTRASNILLTNLRTSILLYLPNLKAYLWMALRRDQD